MIVEITWNSSFIVVTEIGSRFQEPGYCDGRFFEIPLMEEGNKYL